MGKGDGRAYHINSLLGFQSQFPREDSCWKYLVSLRWPDGFVCLQCNHRKADFLKSKMAFECRHCHQQTSVTAGTIFHKTKLPLRKWFWAIFLMATSKKGVSMLYLQRQLRIRSYRAVWLMGQKIRQAMKQRNVLYQTGGAVEVDEIHIGGQQSHEQRREHPNKTPFLMAVEEGKMEALALSLLKNWKLCMNNMSCRHSKSTS